MADTVIFPSSPPTPTQELANTPTQSPVSNLYGFKALPLKGETTDEEEYKNAVMKVKGGIIDNELQLSKKIREFTKILSLFYKFDELFGAPEGNIEEMLINNKALWEAINRTDIYDDLYETLEKYDNNYSDDTSEDYDLYIHDFSTISFDNMDTFKLSCVTYILGSNKSAKHPNMLQAMLKIIFGLIEIKMLELSALFSKISFANFRTRFANPRISGFFNEKIKMTILKYFIGYMEYEKDPDTFSQYEWLLKNESKYYELYNSTYVKLNDCLKQIPKNDTDNGVNVERYFVYHRTRTQMMTILVNKLSRKYETYTEDAVFNFAAKKRKITKETIICEHIFILRTASTLLYQAITGEKGAITAIDMHKHCIERFNPDYIISQPLDIMMDFFKKMETDGLVKILMDDGVDPTTNIIDKDEKIMGYIKSNFGINIKKASVCYYPSLLLENKQKHHYIGGKSKKVLRKRANKTRKVSKKKGKKTG